MQILCVANGDYEIVGGAASLPVTPDRSTDFQETTHTSL